MFLVEGLLGHRLRGRVLGGLRPLEDGPDRGNCHQPAMAAGVGLPDGAVA